MSSHTTEHHSDTRAGFTGLIVGAIFVGAILFGVVRLTNAHYNGEKGGTAKAEQAK